MPCAPICVAAMLFVFVLQTRLHIFKSPYLVLCEIKKKKRETYGNDSFMIQFVSS